jgi:hypothetical protein
VASQLLEQNQRIHLQQEADAVGEIPAFEPLVAAEARDAHFRHLAPPIRGRQTVEALRVGAAQVEPHPHFIAFREHVDDAVVPSRKRMTRIELDEPVRFTVVAQVLQPPALLEVVRAVFRLLVRRLGARDLELVAVLLCPRGIGHELLGHDVTVFTRIGDRRRDEAAVLAFRHLRAELFEQPQLVAHEPAFDDLPVGNTKEPDLVYVDFLSRGRYAEQVAGVRRLQPPQHTDAIVLGDDVLDRIDAIRKRLAQKETRLGKALSFRVGGEVHEPAAQPLVIGREDLTQRGILILRALALLEAADESLVVLESGTRVGGHKRSARESKGCTQEYHRRASEIS